MVGSSRGVVGRSSMDNLWSINWSGSLVSWCSIDRSMYYWCMVSRSSMVGSRSMVDWGSMEDISGLVARCSMVC